MGRNNKNIARVPTWELRLTIWFSQLKNDMRNRGFIDDVRIYTSRFYKAISNVKGIPKSEKTFTNWVSKALYPENDNLENLFSASPISGQWLIPDKSIAPLHYFVTALDYYFCSVNLELKPTLFSPDVQEKFTSRCLTDIADTWNIPFTYKENKLNDDFLIQDISLSMLQTHGSSAIPFYLCSLASNNCVNEDEIYDWYLDLLCSTLIVAANYHREKIELPYPLSPFSTPEYFINKINFLGTSPSLLQLIGDFLFFPDSMPMLSFMNSRHDDINEISNSTRLLERILKGSLDLRTQLKNIGVDYSEISKLIQSQLRTSETSFRHFIQRSNKDNINPIRSFHPPRLPQHMDIVIYHLYPGSPTRVEKEIIINNHSSALEILACRYPDKANDSHYSWGYGGTGVYQMAYTLLYDLFNHEQISREHIEPTRSEEELVVYKLLSRIHSCFKYSISSMQIVHALSIPILKETDQPDNDIVRSFCAIT